MNMHRTSGWGRFPWVDASIHTPRTVSESSRVVGQAPSIIAQGLARSYGDSSLAPTILRTTALDCCLAFDSDKGMLTCQAGVSLDRILQVIVPRGWFLPVTPGTRYVTIGGAIAADVHGKNHHHDGCFSEFVSSIDILTGNGEIVRCSPSEHPELFHATCGGMGLTGIILAASLRLTPIKTSFIAQTTIKAPDLESALAAFAENDRTRYSVAWIDCVTQGKGLGRSLLMLGEHLGDGASLEPHSVPRLTMPLDLPEAALNHYSISLFNTLYYQRIRKTISRNTVHYAPFFYPLDSIRNWNRMYGQRGFTQYQFVIPRSAGTHAVRQILKRIADFGQGSFLAVLKSMGPSNRNLLSFPLDGYTLALDFKYSLELLPLLNELDAMVLDHGGRLYLAKDARMSAATFRSSYASWESFQQVREAWGAIGKFSSLQSRRIGLDA